LSDITTGSISDRPAIEAFLDERLAWAMFPRANLADYGMDCDAPYASRFWLRKAQGAIRDLVALSNNGVVQPCLPSGDFAALAQALNGQEVSALVGPLDQVRGLLGPLGLDTAARTMDSDEPHFLLELADLQTPAGTTHLIPMSDAPMATLRDWFTAYERETLHTPAADAETRGAATLARTLARKAGVVLMQGQTPVAMTSFSAERPTIVQIGSVYTPPEHRGHAHARRAIALHLQQAQSNDVQHATLFSANETASKTYRALGFRQIGDWSVVLLRDKQVIHARPSS